MYHLNLIVSYLISEFDGRMTPLCGYHGPNAALYGLHHYIHYYDAIGLDDLNYDELLHRLNQLVSFVKLKATGK